MTPEGKVKRKVTALLKRYAPDLFYTMPVPCGYGTQMLDYFGCYRGHYFEIETKAPTGKLTARQSLRIKQVIASGGSAFVVRDDHTLGEFEKWLQTLKTPT